ncbi:hypothetical protein ACFSR2_10845 [Emticicia soli]|uniref:CopG family transcriptional regulator n=2 Tax=Emticicia soli TaxID=2027878 RepID=A0ABW5J6W1_9BACT
MEQSEKKKGRKPRRDSNRTETIIMRVTPEEKELIKKFHKDSSNRNLSLTDHIINSVFHYALKYSFRLPVDEIKKLELPALRRK